MKNYDFDDPENGLDEDGFGDAPDIGGGADDFQKEKETS